jgi:hypothetical protein
MYILYLENMEPVTLKYLRYQVLHLQTCPQQEKFLSVAIYSVKRNLRGPCQVDVHAELPALLLPHHPRVVHQAEHLHHHVLADPLLSQ